MQRILLRAARTLQRALQRHASVTFVAAPSVPTWQGAQRPFCGGDWIRCALKGQVAGFCNAYVRLFVCVFNLRCTPLQRSVQPPQCVSMCGDRLPCILQLYTWLCPATHVLASA